MQLSLFMLISDMKKFILKIVLFFLVLAIIDLLLGKVFRYAYQHAVGGYTERYHYIYSGTHEDALVFGSSRALDNFVPDTIEKYLRCRAMIVVKMHVEFCLLIHDLILLKNAISLRLLFMIYIILILR